MLPGLLDGAVIAGPGTGPGTGVGDEVWRISLKNDFMPFCATAGSMSAGYPFKGLDVRD